MQSCLMPRMASHLVQELNVYTATILNIIRHTMSNDLEITLFSFKLPIKDTVRFVTSWGADGVNPEKTRVHVSYIDKVCRRFHREVEKRLLQTLGKEQHRTDDELMYEDILYHVQICQTL